MPFLLLTPITNRLFSGSLIYLDDKQELKKQVKKTFEKPEYMPRCPGTKVRILDSR